MKRERDDEDEENDIKVQIRSRSDFLASSTIDSTGISRDIREGNKRHHSCSSTSSNCNTDDEQNSKPRTYELETDPLVLTRRQKQIEYGKNTTEYFNYSQAVPKFNRQPFHPKTPNKMRKYSRRAWDGLVRQWRLNLHCWSEFPISASTELQENENGADHFNESFHSESTVESTSTSSSSIATSFAAGIVFSNKIKLDNNKIKHETYNDSDEEEDFTGRRKPKKLLLDVNVKKENSLENDCMMSKVEPKNIRLENVKVNEVLSTSWADEVEDYLEECSGDHKG